jgi:hypothetical protein
MRCPRGFRAYGLGVTLLPALAKHVAKALCIGEPGAADARGKPRECKPSGAPVALSTPGAIEVAEPVRLAAQQLQRRVSY